MPPKTEGRLLAEEIIRNIRHDVGVDLLPILQDESVSLAERRNHAVFRLLEGLVNRAEESEHRAEWRQPDGVDESPFLNAVAAGGVEVEPNIVMAQTDANRLKAMQGGGVKDYLFGLSARLERMSKASTPADLALQIVTGGLISVGAPMAAGAFTAMRAGQAILSAIRIGVTGIGMRTAIGAVVIVLATVLLWLLLENPKKILGLVLNDTDENFVVPNWRNGVDGGHNSNLWMEHGSMKNFMQDYEAGDLTKTIQLNARAYFGPGDPDNSVFGGLYFADKNFGFRGAEGVMLFTSRAINFAHMFAVPYTNDNGTNMEVTGPRADMPALFRHLYNNRRVRVAFGAAGYAFTSTVNDPRGGVVGCIASITRQ